MTTVYLLSIRGILALKTLEAARAVHNETAGAPANVAAARALGDLSHMVYVPMEHEGHHGNEFLILDQRILQLPLPGAFRPERSDNRRGARPGPIGRRSAGQPQRHHRQNGQQSPRTRPHAA